MLYKIQRYDFRPYNKIYFFLGDNDLLTKDKALGFIGKNKVQIDLEKVIFLNFTGNSVLKFLLESDPFEFIELSRNHLSLIFPQLIFVKIPPSRQNKQGYLKSLIVVVFSMIKTFLIYLSIEGDFEAIISNGPALALSVFASAYLKSVTIPRK